jgi:predicted small secreted protein
MPSPLPEKRRITLLYLFLILCNFLLFGCDSYINGIGTDLIKSSADSFIMARITIA